MANGFLFGDVRLATDLITVRCKSNDDNELEESEEQSPPLETRLGGREFSCEIPEVAPMGYLQSLTRW
jgi:hypothetical protein